MDSGSTPSMMSGLLYASANPQGSSSSNGSNNSNLGGSRLDHTATIDILCDFLEVAIHTILYVRQVYPVESFERRKKLNVPVWMNRHPELNQYILDIVTSLRPWLENKLVSKVAINISKLPTGKDTETAALAPASAFDSHSPTLVERFVFEIQSLVLTSAAAAAAAAAPLPSAPSASLPLGDIELMLRGVLQKISISDAFLQPVRPDELETRTFTVCVFTDTSASEAVTALATATNQPLPQWVLADPGDAGIAQPLIHPLKAVNTGLVRFQLYAEESPEFEQRR